ncbi:MAG TPA: NAD(P)-dependent oxidoreductase, partial [Chthonomonadaceae bacterium]|nr:NAD(P)-dependent oxidoreductase [Chthonomonadaceae bacterium]
MPTSVLVPGGAGYLGSILCDHLLQAGYRVTVLDNLLYGQHSLFQYCAHPDFRFVFGDARDEQTLCREVAKADVIINLAAIVGAPACDRDPWLARSVNYEAVKLLNKLRSPQQLILQPTTNSGYGAQSGE